MNELMKKLQKPFPANIVEWRVGPTNAKPKANPPIPATRGIALPYIDVRAIQDRLDEVFGPLGWKNEYREWKGKSQLCGISVWDADSQQWITKWDGAEDSDMESVKGGLSDSMKRAAFQWGIGRYLYKLPRVWVPLVDGRIEKAPELPSWALPEGEKGDVHEERRPPTDDKSSDNGTEVNKGNIEGKCTDCGKDITKAVELYSLTNFGRHLCKGCQTKEKARVKEAK